ncbi:hypothetical protein N7495_005403 [Penicillium taxi]|uniref:uncharacterized protein n=1 Tax=Penicillium taxi TaxID=168475 RepID=UPI002544EED1|nr:uncharacterized protein N7495_005403 [Penicillium taxi]KAJ5893712.1 hypothetical protein N7495_005403 [Penicillium taxi]
MGLGLSISRLFGKGEELMSSTEKLRVKCKQLISQKSRLEMDLYEAHSEIDRLKAHVAEYDVLLAHFRSRKFKHQLTKLHTNMRPESSNLPVSTTDDWIGDIWLCSDSHRGLHKAEYLWKMESLEFAKEAASHAIYTNQFLSIGDVIRYRIFIAAVLHSMKQYGESNSQLDEISDALVDYNSFNGHESKELIGMANFVRGRNLLVLQQFEDAYLCLSRAVNTPGYKVKARQYQQELINKFIEKEATEAHAFVVGHEDHLASLILAGDEYEKLDYFY